MEDLIKKLLVLLSILAFAVSCGRGGGRVAKVGGETLNKKQLNIFSKDHKEQNGKEDFIIREIAFRIAEKDGLLTGASFDETRKIAREDVLVRLYLDKKAGAAAFTEKDAKEFYQRHREKVLTSHILFKTREEAEIAKNRIKGGEKFESVAGELSTDTSTKEKGGDLGWIAKGMTVQPFEDALFSAKKGDLLGPVKTDFGYHLILARDRTLPTDEEFSKNKEMIFEAMEKNRQISEKEKITKALKEKYPLKGYEDVLDQDRTTEVFEGDDGRIAGSVAGADITLKELKAFIGEVMRIRGGGHSLGASTKLSFMEIIADQKRIVKAAEDEKLDKTEEFSLLYEDAVKDKAYETCKADFLKTYEPPEAGLKKFYEPNRDLFKELAQVRLDIIVTSDSAKAQTIILESKSSDFKSLYDKYADKESTGDMDTGLIEISSLARFFPPDALEKIEASGIGEIAGPFRFQDGYLVVKVVEKLFKDSPSFDYSRERVKSEFIKQKGDESFRNYLNGEGRKKVKVEIFS